MVSTTVEQKPQHIVRTIPQKNKQLNKKLSIIVPIYNEQDTIQLIFETLIDLIKNLNYDYEIIFINDGSTDNSWHIVSQIANSNKKVKGFSFSRNFGHQIALTAGYDNASGDAIITIDADMQDPPQLVLEMIKKWEQGSDIVYARRIDRHDSWLKKITALMYYKFLDLVSDVTMPRNVGDFRLIDKKVLQTINVSREKSRYLRGMVAWTGFTHEFIDFERPNRIAGTTGYTWSKMFKLAFDGITGFSLFPLKVAAFVGVFVINTGVLMFLYITLDSLLNDVVYPLFKWLVTIIYIFMGVQFLLLWLIGEYIGRMYDQQKGRPLYIVDKKINKDE